MFEDIFDESKNKKNEAINVKKSQINFDDIFDASKENTQDVLQPQETKQSTFTEAIKEIGLRQGGYQDLESKGTLTPELSAMEKAGFSAPTQELPVVEMPKTTEDYMKTINAPQLEIKQGSFETEKKDTLLNKTLKFVLPKSLELKFGLRKPTEKENIQSWGKAVDDYYGRGEDIVGGIKTFGEGLTKLPKAVSVSVLQAMQGLDGASVVNKDWADEYINDANNDINSFIEKTSEKYKNKLLISGLPIKIKDIAELPQNLAFSLTSMGAGLGVGIPTGYVSPVVAWTLGTSASGAVAYNMTTYQIMQQYLEAKNAEQIEKTGKGLTLEQENLLKDKFSLDALKYGLWEAVPEAISNASFVGILTAPLKKIVGKTVAGKILNKVSALYGEELLTETITQKGQSDIEVEAKLRDNKITWVEAFKEVAPQTFLLTTVMAGAGSAVIGVSKAKEKIMKSLKNEIGENSPLYKTIEENINKDLNLSEDQSEQPTDIFEKTKPVDILDVVEQPEKQKAEEIKTEQPEIETIISIIDKDGNKTEYKKPQTAEEIVEEEKTTQKNRDILLNAKTGVPFTAELWNAYVGDVKNNWYSSDLDEARAYLGYKTKYSKDGKLNVDRNIISVENPFVAKDQNEVLSSLGNNELLQKSKEEMGSLRPDNPLVKEADDYIKSELMKDGYDAVVYTHDGRRVEMQKFPTKRVATMPSAVDFDKIKDNIVALKEKRDETIDGLEEIGVAKEDEDVVKKENEPKTSEAPIKEEIKTLKLSEFENKLKDFIPSVSKTFESPVMDYNNNLWGNMYNEFQQSIETPNDNKISQLSNELDTIKKDKTDQAKQRKKAINVEIDNLKQNTESANNIMSEEFIKYDLDLVDFANKEAKKQGLELSEEQQSDFRDDFLTRISERPYIESNWEMPVKDVLADMIEEYKIPKIEFTEQEIKTQKAISEITKGEEKPKKKKSEFNVGDMIDTQGGSNMASPVTIREITGNTIKFTDAEGTEFGGMARSDVRNLIANGEWKKVSSQEKPVEVEKELLSEKTEDEARADVISATFEKYGNEAVKKAKELYNKDLEDLTLSQSLNLGEELDKGIEPKEIEAEPIIDNEVIDLASLERIKKEYKAQGKTAEEFSEEVSHNSTVYNLRNVLSEIDPVVNVLNQKITGKQIEFSKNIELGVEAKKTAQSWAGSVRGINNIDRKLFSETRRALVDKYNSENELTQPLDKDIIKIDEQQPTKQLNRDIGRGNKREILPEALPMGDRQSTDTGGTTAVSSRQLSQGKYRNGDDLNGERYALSKKNQVEINSQIEKLVADKGDNSSSYTEDEKNLLSQYSGYGGLEQGGAENRGLLDEYFTPQKVVSFVWSKVNNLLSVGADNKISILEPAVGTGNFINEAPANSSIDAYEINETSAKITKILYPNANVNTISFERLFIDDRGNKSKWIGEYQKKGLYNLVIGNPPYGEHRGIYKGLGEEPKISKYEEYFLKRSLDITKEGGIVAMVVPSGFLRSDTNYAKVEISKLGKLVDAYRLPNNTFDNTSIGTDIVIFQKETITDLVGGGTAQRYNLISGNKYFDKNPDKILGVEKERKGRFGGMEKYVEGSLDFIPEQIKEIEKVVEVNDPTETKTEKQDIVNAIENEIESGAIINEKEFVKNWSKKDVNQASLFDPMPKFTGTIKATTEQGTPANKNKSIIMETPKKTSGILDLSEYYKDKSDKEIMTYTEIEATGEVKDSLLKSEFSDEASKLAYLNFMNGKWYNNFNYFSGDIYEKLDNLEINKDRISKAQYDKQRKGLMAVLPTIHPIDKINISPNTPFAELEIDYQGEKTSLKRAFINFLDTLPRDSFSDISKWEIKEYVLEKTVRGNDAIRNQAIRSKRAKAGNRFFSMFIREGLEKEQSKYVESQFNRTLNYYANVDYRNVPLLGKLHKIFKDKILTIYDYQLQGIGFLVNKGAGLLAHDVGLGKTMQSIIAINESMKRGWVKRPVIVVPTGNVYGQWINEIQELLPDAKINDLSNLGGRFKGDLGTLDIGDNTISIMTYQGFKKLGFKQETYSELTTDLQDVIGDTGEMTERNYQKEKAKVEEAIGKGIKGTLSEKTFEDLGFDLLHIDEVHNANHIFSGAKIKEQGKTSEYKGLKVRPSQLGIKAWLASQYIQKRNNGRNVFATSASPFTNNPMEIYAIISLFSRNLLKRIGVNNVNEFANMFFDIGYDFEVTADGRYVEKQNIRGIKNFQQFQKLFGSIIDFRDGEEVGIKRPERITVKTILKPNKMQVDLMEQAQEIFKDKKAGSFKGIDETKKITFTPYASKFYIGQRPTYKEFVENSPKIKAMVEMIRQNKKDNKGANQLIYSSNGVDYFPLIKDYLVKELSFKPDEVAVIVGSVKSEDRVEIQDKFNSGKIKIIIGSTAIREGVNLQIKTTDLYILSLPWNFVDLKQIAGRVWRQGNEWKSIRIHNLFIENSIDVFLSQKLENKQKLYEETLKNKGDYLDIGDIDFDELKLDLIKSPTRRVSIEKAQETKRRERALNEAKSDLGFYSRKAKKLAELQEKVSEEMEGLEDYRNWAKKEKEDGDANNYWGERLVDQENRVNRYKAEYEIAKKEAEEKGLINNDQIEMLTKNVENAQKQVDNINKEFETKENQAKADEDIIIQEIRETTNDYAKVASDLATQNKTFFVKTELKKTMQSGYKAPSGKGMADIGMFNEDTPVVLGGMDKIRPIQTPEMVEIVKEITGKVPTVNSRLRRKMGVFFGRGNGEIQLKPSLFKDPVQVAKTLAHEIGHLADWLPQIGIKRRSLLQKLFILNNHIKTEFGGDLVKNKDIKEELWNLSTYWRPLGEKPTEGFLKYRRSANELYADAVSVLFNSPGLLEQKAPLFYRAFFASLDNKPSINEKYWEIQDLLFGAKEDLYKVREMRVKRGFERAEDIQKTFEDKRNNADKRLYERMRQQLDNQYFPILKKIQEDEAKGIVIDDNANPKYLLNELPYTNNENFLLIDKLDKEISQPVKNAGMSDDEIGIYLLLDRIRTGRKEIANPYGFDLNTAEEQINFLKDRVGEENFKLLQDKVQLFHDEVRRSVVKAKEVGSYRKDAEFEENYATFAVVDYLQDYMPATIKKQTGTFKEVANPYHLTLLKTLALNKLNALQTAKNSVRDWLLEIHPEEIKKSKEIRSGKMSIYKAEKGFGQLQILEDGKLKSYDVDPLIADSFEYDIPDTLKFATDILGKVNQYFKSLVTTYNLGFALGFNPIRDFKRNYKMIPNANLLNLATAYINSFPSASKYAKGQLDEITKQMVEDKLINAPMYDYNFDPREDELSGVLKNYGIIKNSTTERELPLVMNNARKFLLKPIIKILEAIRYTANTFETVSKIAGTKVRMAGGEEGKRLGYNVRTYTGTPNWKVKGKATYITNEVFIFSNIMKEGIKSGIEIGFNRKTAGGYWWKTIKIDYSLKILMFMATAGLLGDALKDFFDKVSEYDKTNYIIIPLGMNEEGKAIYARIPHDEDGRLTSAMLWKGLNIIKDKDPKQLQDILAIGAGQLPGVTPVISVTSNWIQYATGRNPYDAFRGRTLIDDTTFQAGGVAGLKKMVQWTANTAGLSQFTTYDTNKNTTAETLVQTLPLVNRLFKISDYGLTEQAKKIQNEIKTERARELLNEKEAINKYVKIYQKDWKSGKIDISEISDMVIKDVLGKYPETKEEEDREKNIKTKLKRSLKIGAFDTRIDALIYTQTNKEKIGLLNKYKEIMSSEDFNDLIETSFEEGVISRDIYYQF